MTRLRSRNSTVKPARSHAKSWRVLRNWLKVIDGIFAGGMAVISSYYISALSRFFSSADCPQLTDLLSNLRKPMKISNRSKKISAANTAMLERCGSFGTRVARRPSLA